MSEWTKEPWTKHHMAALFRSHYRGAEDDGQTSRDLGRILACVNACAGMADPPAEIAELRDDRAQLVETLEAIARGDYIVTADSHDAASDTLERLADAEKMRRIRRE